MPLSPIDLCSRALLKVGAKSISSFDEGTVESEVAASLYPIIRDALLSAHPWNFATVQTGLARLSVAPIAEFSFRFQLPVDCLRVLSAGSVDRGRGLRYRITNRQLLSNADEVFLTYIGRPPEVDFPPFFQSVLITQLAAEFCIPLTDSTSRWEALQKAADLELRRARLIDAQEETPAGLEDFTLLVGRS